MQHLKEGTKFAEKYTLVKLLGVGGFSEVWLAERSNGFEQALKIYTGLDEAGIGVFRAEFERVFNLNHARILTPSDFGVYEKRPYLMMPYCKNGSALSLIGMADEKMLAKVIVDIGSALEYLHTRPDFIIHQDIKPDNFLVDDAGNFMLTDFGISTRFRATLKKSINKIERKTAKHDSKQTSGITPPSYRAPEMYAKDRNTREPIMATDIWAFGASLYELATGELPYGEFGGLLQQQGVEWPELPETFSPGFSELLTRCMAKETWDRPTAGELVRAANNYLTNQQWALKDTPPTPPHPDPPHPDPKEKSLAKKLMIPLIALVVLLLGGGGWYMNQQATLKEEAGKRYDSGEQKMKTRYFYAARNDYQAVKAMDLGIFPDLDRRIAAASDSISANVAVHLDASASFVADKKYAEAGISLRKALGFDPENKAARKQLAQIEQELDKIYAQEIKEAEADLGKNKFAQAAQHATVALGIRPNDEAATTLRRTIRTDSVNFYFNYFIKAAKTAQNDQDYDEAITNVDEAIKIKASSEAQQLRKDINNDREASFNKLVGSARRAENQGECSTARNLYQQALYVKPNASDIKANMEALRCIKTATLSARPRGTYTCIKFISAEVNESQTLVKMRFPASCGGGNVSLYAPGNPNAYLLMVGRKSYPVKRISGISPGRNLKFSADKYVSFYFDRIPEGTSSFNLKEGSRQIDPSNTYWNFDNIKLTWK